jgi:putative transposase
MSIVFRKNEIIEAGGKQYLFDSAVNLEQIVAVDPLSGEKTILALSSVNSVEAKTAVKVSAINAVEPERWDIAKKRYQAIRPLLTRGREPDAYKKVAANAGVNVATVFRWRKRFLRSGLLSALLPEKPGVNRGTTRLDDTVEAILQDLVQNVWMKDCRTHFTDFYTTLVERCIAAKKKAPHPNTIRKRLLKFSEQRSKEDQELAPDQILARPLGSLTAEFPLEIIQIDHTPLDVILVDESYRLPLGRPYITVAMDVATRVILGFYVSFDPPNANSVGICLYRSIRPKAEWLRSLGFEQSWPMWGLPGTVYADNGKEFRGEMLTSVCEEYGINLQWRPVRKPRWGGHIERLMGEFAREMKRLPGATFSNPKERGDYDSEGNAVMTLRELERYLISLICETYHVRQHRSLRKSPHAAWHHGTLGPAGIGLPRMVADEKRLRMNLLPFFERTISEYGVVIDNVHYYDDALRPYVGAVLPGKHQIRRKFQFRRDPGDISVIHFLDPESNEFLEIPYRDTSLPAVTKWELQAAANALAESGDDDQTEEKLFAAILKRRQMVNESKLKTKQARRAREQQNRAEDVRIKRKETPPPPRPDKNPPPPPPLYEGIRLT